MVAVILVLAFSNKLVENTPDFQEAKPSSSTDVEQPTPSTENALSPAMTTLPQQTPKAKTS